MVVDEEMKQKMLAKWFSMLSVLIILLGVSVPQAKAEIVHKEKFQIKWSYIREYRILFITKLTFP